MASIRTLALLTGLACCVLSEPAWAHGDATHPKTAQPTREQKAWGVAGDAKAVRRSIQITMSDTLRFTPDVWVVKRGETVRLVLRNSGALLHEFVLGTRKELEQHAAMMVKSPTMEHAEPCMAHLPAGQTGEIVWAFNRAGEFEFACLIAGHFKAGMTGKVTVTTR